MNKICKAFFSIFIVATVFLSCFGCAIPGITAQKSGKISEAESSVGNVSGEYHVFRMEQTSGTVAFSSYLTMYFDAVSNAVAVRDMSSDKLWCSLPLSGSGVSDSNACVAQISVVQNNKRYLLNTQDNSVAIGTASYAVNEFGVNVAYILSNDSKIKSGIEQHTADKTVESYLKGLIAIEVNVSYQLKDGNLFVSLTYKNLGDPKAVVENIDLLNWFGCTATAEKDDFILVPDGSGALINTSALPKRFDEVRLSVYGNDQSAVQNLPAAIAPVFGMRQGSSAFATIIEKGDALAVISARTKATPGSQLNRVGAQFTVTPSGELDGNSYISDYSYSDELRLCYRFLSGNSADYSGIASSCREQLMRNAVLSTRSVKEAAYLPLVLTLHGSAVTSGVIGHSKTLTDFATAKDIVSRIKAKGINSIALRYNGALSGSDEQEDISSATLLRKLGGRKGFNELGTYMSAQNLELYLNVNLLTSLVLGNNEATGLYGKAGVQIVFPKMFTFGFGKESSAFKLRRLDNLEDTVLNVLNRFNHTNFTGYCLNDIGSLLYTDYSTGIDRQASAEMIAEKIVPLSTNNKIMVDTGNFRTLKNASIVSGIPFTTSYEQSEAYTGIPLVQIILHGIVEYSPAAINLEDDSQTAFLRCLEYGACPGFEFVGHIPKKASKEFSEKYDCELWFNTVADYYSACNEVLSRLRASRITDHYEIADGVYCTEYEAVNKVFVNYNDKSYFVDDIGIIVPAKGYEYYPQ